MDIQEKISKQLEQISEQLEVLIRLMAIQYEANNPTEDEEPPAELKPQPKQPFKSPPVPPQYCPECRAPLVLRSGRNGTFWGCSSYPRCRYSRNA